MALQRLHRRQVVVQASSVFRPNPWNASGASKGGLPPPSLLEVKEAWQVARSLERRADQADYLLGHDLNLDRIETHLPIVEALERQYHASPSQRMRVDFGAQVDRMAEWVASYLLTAYVVVMFLWSCLYDDEEDDEEEEDDDDDEDAYVL